MWCSCADLWPLTALLSANGSTEWSTFTTGHHSHEEKRRKNKEGGKRKSKDKVRKPLIHQMSLKHRDRLTHTSVCLSLSVYLCVCVQKKKVLTAYQIFYKEYRNSILEEEPGLGGFIFIFINQPVCVSVCRYLIISLKPHMWSEQTQLSLFAPETCTRISYPFSLSSISIKTLNRSANQIGACCLQSCVTIWGILTVIYMPQ